jgi:hypothetical protein
MDLIPPAITLLLLVGAIILWRRTKRASALLQLFAASGLFLFMWLELIAQFLAIVCHRTQLLDALRGSHVQTAEWIVLLISGFAFPVGYLWYALTQERI